MPTAKEENSTTQSAKATKKTTEEKAILFDGQLFGLLLRRERMNAGLKTAKAFSEYILAKTGLYISQDTLYRIEGGKQQPALDQAIAISLSFSHGGLFGGIRNMVEISSCSEWLDMARGERYSYAQVYDEDIPF